MAGNNFGAICEGNLLHTHDWSLHAESRYYMCMTQLCNVINIVLILIHFHSQKNQCRGTSKGWGVFIGEDDKTSGILCKFCYIWHDSCGLAQ